jgi:hypothetical protein
MFAVRTGGPSVGEAADAVEVDAVLDVDKDVRGVRVASPDLGFVVLGLCCFGDLTIVDACPLGWAATSGCGCCC